MNLPVAPPIRVQRVRLQNEADFTLGAALVRPSKREIIVDGQRETLERRVMQVLVALAATPGETVTRDELLERCWDGLVVSDDAVNRAICRLRTISRHHDGRSYSIETVPKLGYRLIGERRCSPLVPTAATTVSGSSAAQAAYLRGRYLWNKETEAALELALSEFRTATRIDPAFALGHVGVADVLLLQAQWGYEDWREALTEAREAAATALELEPQLSQALAVAGRVAYTLDWDWRRAERLLNAAVETSGGEASAFIHLARLLEILGRYEEAIQVAAQALEREPASIIASNALAMAHRCARDWPRAEQQYRRSLALERSNVQALYQLAWTFAYAGDLESAAALAVELDALEGGSLLSLGLNGYIHARRGDGERARELIRLQEERTGERSLYDAIAALAALGDDEQALALLEDEFRRRSFVLLFVTCEPAFDTLRGHSRFQDIVRRLRLPPSRW